MKTPVSPQRRNAHSVALLPCACTLLLASALGAAQAQVAPPVAPFTPSVPNPSAAPGPGAEGASAKGKAARKKSSRTAPRAEPVTLNFVNAEIEGVARAMSVILKQPFVVDPRVKGSITLYSETPIAPSEAYLNFQTALRGLGFAVVEVGGMNRIVPEADAKLQSATVEVGESDRRGDVVVTQIFKLNHENPNNLVAILRPLISPNNIINANPGNNSLVITDYADNLARMGKIIAALDTAGATDLEVVSLKHAVATDVAALLQRFNEAGANAGVPGPGGNPTIVVDSRSNSLLVRAPSALRMAQLRSMIDKLDKPLSGQAAQANIWVVYLKNADATKLATVLRAAFAANSSAGGAAGAGGASGPASPSAIPGLPGSNSNPGGFSGAGMNLGGNAGGSPQATAPLQPSAGPSTGGFIQADPSTNSLIITAAEPLYRQLRTVIDQLDGRRAQVYIESMIVKVDAAKGLDLGFQWQGISGNYGDSAVVGAGSNFGTSGTPNIVGLSTSVAQGSAGLANLAKQIPAGFNVGLLKKVFVNSSGKPIYTLGALANFLETQAGGNVLSTPNLIALDNEEAKIVIGQNVPFITGSFTNSGGGTGGVNPFQTIERKDVGLTLKVKPQIGEGGNVRLTIYQENSAVLNSTVVGSAGPTTDKSAIETTVTVDDGQILVLGGLLKEEVATEVNKVPLLGDIPVLGHLFRSDSKKRGKSNLMVFLRPVVIRSQAASDALTLDRYESIRAILPTSDSNLLPAVPGKPASAEAGAAEKK
jgi:general secretion pathway protein D